MTGMRSQLLVIVLGAIIAGCQAGSIRETTTAAQREPAALPERTWMEFDYDQPQKAGFFNEAIWRSEELSRNATLIKACSLTRDFYRQEAVEQELFFIRLGSWSNDRILGQYSWLNETSLRCLLRAPNS